MRRLKMAAAAALILVIMIAGGAWLMRSQIALGLMARVYDRAMASDPIASLPDGLSVGLCGSGSPMPDPTRAGPCEVVVAGRQLFVVDSGQGSTKNLALMNLPPAQVTGVFLTHYH